MIVQNQIGGGGLSNAELAEATATADQVFKGKTFFAGDDILKTGAFDLSLANATAAQVLSGYKFYAGNSTLKTGTLVPSGRSKSGTFKDMDDGATLTIECGFKPLMVVISTYSLDWKHDSLSYYFNGHSYGVYIREYPSKEPEEISGQISVTSTGFEVHNVMTSDGNGIYYIAQTYSYYAVG